MQKSACLLLVGAALLFSGCGGQSVVRTVQDPPNPVPTLSSLSPSYAAVGAAPFTLTVTGSGFVPGSVVRWNNADRPTTYIRTTELTAAISGADVAAAANANVTVFNPAPVGGSSNVGVFAVKAPASIVSLTPPAVLAGAAAFSLSVTGTNFATTSVVRWNNSDRVTTYVKDTELTAAITAADVAAMGAATVSVYTPPPGTGLSNLFNFVISAGPLPPAIGGLSPSRRQVALPGFTLVVSGMRFVAGSVVQWNGSDRPTTFISSTELRAAISAADTAAAGVMKITVVNPAGASPALTSTPYLFDVDNPTPSLASIVPSSAIVGGAGFTLIVNGSGFLPTSVVRWNNTDRPTTFVSPTLLSASIAAADIATAASVSVQVINPAPIAGPVESLTFEVGTANPVPAISALVPSSISVGPPPSSVSVEGSGFTTSSVVRWNGSERTTSFFSSTRIGFAPEASDLKVGSVATIDVFNRGPGGGTSNALSLPVNNPSPVLASIRPAVAIVGDAATTVELTGTGFVSNSAVQWNGNPRPASFVSSFKLAVVLSPADLASAGTAQFTVVNPLPAGGSSAAVPFSIAARTTYPQPAIGSLADQQAPAGWPGLSLRVTGTGFVAATVLQLDGADRPTVALSSTELRAAIPAADLLQPRTVQVTIKNPSPGGGASNASPFTVSPVAANSVGVIDMPSKDNEYVASLAPVGGYSFSNDGRYLAFESESMSASGGSINAVYLRDTCRGAAPDCIPSFTRVSQNDLGQAADRPSNSAVISGNGRYVAFTSGAANLVAGAAGFFVFVRDTCNGAPSGCVPSLVRTAPADANGTLSLFSASDNGRYLAYSAASQPPAAGVLDTCLGAAAPCTPADIARIDGADAPRISSNGRYLVFSTYRADLVADDANNSADIYLYDLCLGATGACTRRAIRVSVGPENTESNADSFAASVSRDGRFVVFSSWATNLVAGDSGVGHQVYLRDTCLGDFVLANCMPTTYRISVSDAGVQVRSGGPATGGVAVSADGRYVVFGSNRGGLVPNIAGAFHVYLRDTCVGIPNGCTPSTRALSVSLNGTVGDLDHYRAWISPDGRLAAFLSNSTNLGPGTGSPTPQGQVYVAKTGRP